MFMPPVFPAHWHVSQPVLIADTFSSLVWKVSLPDGTPAIVKGLKPIKDIADELRGADYLVWRNGRGAVRLLGRENNLMLLEYAGERMLSHIVAEHGDYQATEIAAEQIAKLTGADLYRIEAAEAYNADPYRDSDRVKKEAYENLRPKVANLPEASLMAKYDTIFVGSPIWWHQPAMVICTFLEAFDLKGKTLIPFFTYDATTYLNESMQQIYRLTPHSRHIPSTLPEDLDPGDITTPGRADDEGIDMPGNAAGVKTWLKRIGMLP